MSGAGTGIDDDAWPDFSQGEPDYWLSEDGIAEVMRALSDYYGNFHHCPVKRCLRARRCQGPDMICQLKAPSRSAPPADVAAIHARMRRIVLHQLECHGIW